MVLGLFDWMFGKKMKENEYKTTLKMINDAGGGFYEWGGRLYQSDIVRACIRPKSKAIGKLIAKHIRDNENGFQTNPDNDIRFLLEEPNPLMTGQMLQEKVANQLELNNNAFILIKRDDLGYAYELYPIPAVTVEMLQGQETIYLRFQFTNGQYMVVPYDDVIHLRQDFNEHQLFGDSQQQALSELMNVVSVIDQGMVKAIKQSSVIRWIMKFTQVLKKQDIQEQIDTFTDNYLNIDKSGGAVPADPRYELDQVKPNNFVPDDKQMNNITKRIYDYFNTNQKIVQSTYNEDEWNAYFESVIQPIAMQLSNEYTRKVFTRRERARGNKIIFESSALQYASMTTKMNLVQMVDRGALTPNEWRKILNLGPIENGDKPVRRLDTAEVEGSEKDDDSSGEETDS